MAKTLLGKLKPAAVGMRELPRIPADVLEGYRALADLTGTVSDALDECGIAAAVPGSVLRPTEPRARIVGQAITVKNARVASRNSRLADIEAHNLAAPGDVLVIQGVANVSSMGGVSATVGRRQKEAGAIVDGAVRDTDHSRSIGYPVWSSSVSPITGKRRIETMAVNKRVKIAGIAVNPGDLVIADEVGVCFVPLSRAAEVLEVAQRLARAEGERLRKLAAGISLREFVALQKK